MVGSWSELRSGWRAEACPTLRIEWRHWGFGGGKLQVNDTNGLPLQNVRVNENWPMGFYWQNGGPKDVSGGSREECRRAACSAKHSSRIRCRWSSTVMLLAKAQRRKERKDPLCGSASWRETVFRVSVDSGSGVSQEELWFLKALFLAKPQRRKERQQKVSLCVSAAWRETVFRFPWTAVWQKESIHGWPSAERAGQCTDRTSV